VILPFRAKKSAELYQKIWTAEGSPLLIYSQKIAKKLEETLQIPVALGMHYGEPSIEMALEQLRDVEKIIILPLYPQYSATTTASAFDHIATVFKKWRKLPALQMINHYADNPVYITSLVTSIQNFWKVHGRAQHLLFSFHGIPERFVRAGDPYFEFCELTTRLVTANEWTLSFQSRLGRAKWLTPYTDKILRKLPARGITHLQVICPGFAVDCLETLEEIAIRGREQFLDAGGEIFEYIPALNDSDRQVQVLESLVS
jgi:ferrochelatase